MFSQSTIALFLAMSLSPAHLNGYISPAFPYAPAAGEEGSTARRFDDEAIVSWASFVETIAYGSDVAEEWMVPGNALGPAATGEGSMLVLGRGGSVVLGFPTPITNGPGDDFLVFENAFSDNFLELAYVEISSDGRHFARFPGYSQTPGPVPAFGVVNPTFVHGFAGKYRYGFGTPFDLEDIRQAYEAALLGEGGFSDDYRSHLVETVPFVDLDAVRFVRIVDIPGDGSRLDSEGFPIYDPYPTVITAGFDLDAVGVINQLADGKQGFADWCASHGVEVDWSGDPDKDHWANSLEYLFGSDPDDRASVPRVHRVLSVDGSFLLLNFDLNESAMGRPVVEVSTNGSDWREVEVLVAGELSLPDDAGGRLAYGVRLELINGTRGLLVRFLAVKAVP